MAQTSTLLNVVFGNFFILSPLPELLTGKQ